MSSPRADYNILINDENTQQEKSTAPTPPVQEEKPSINRSNANRTSIRNRINSSRKPNCCTLLITFGCLGVVGGLAYLIYALVEAGKHENTHRTVTSVSDSDSCPAWSQDSIDNVLNNGEVYDSNLKYSRYCKEDSAKANYTAYNFIQHTRRDINGNKFDYVKGVFAKNESDAKRIAKKYLKHGLFNTENKGEYRGVTLLKFDGDQCLYKATKPLPDTDPDKVCKGTAPQLISKNYDERITSCANQLPNHSSFYKPQPKTQKTHKQHPKEQRHQRRM